MARRFGLLDILLWLWVVIVAGYLAWGAYSYTGLYKFLAQWQIEHWGSYQIAWTAFVPGFVLAGPALAWIGARERLRAALSPDDPAAKLRRSARVVVPLGLIGLVVAGGAYLFSTTLPDADAPPATVDLASMGEAVPPEGPVILVGEAVTARTVIWEETSNSTTRREFYVPIVVAGAEAAPIRYFLKTNATHYLDPAARRPQPYDGSGDPVFAITTQAGVLIANDLPGAVAAYYRDNGVALAERYYVLDLSPFGARDRFYIVAGVAGLVGFMFLAAGLAQWVKSRRLARA